MSKPNPEGWQKWPCWKGEHSTQKEHIVLDKFGRELLTSHRIYCLTGTILSAMYMLTYLSHAVRLGDNSIFLLCLGEETWKQKSK